jgi:hypothetical protein
MPETQSPATLALGDILKREDVHALICLVAVAVAGTRDQFTVQVCGTETDPRMAWTMLCAARHAFQDRYGFSDTEARQPGAEGLH